MLKIDQSVTALIAAMGLAGACQLTMAQQPPSGSAPKSSKSAVPSPAADGELSAAKSLSLSSERRAVLEAQLQELEVKAKIASKQDELRRLSTTNQTAAVDDGYVPNVLEINGVDGKLWAQVTLQNGATQVVRPGDVVAGWEVRSISIDSVMVRKGKSLLKLGFSAFPTVASQTLPPSAAAPIPPYAGVGVPR